LKNIYNEDDGERVKCTCPLAH